MRCGECGVRCGEGGKKGGVEDVGSEGGIDRVGVLIEGVRCGEEVRGSGWVCWY